MKYLKFHKFVNLNDKHISARSDVYVNPEKIIWVDEAVDDGKRHACICLGNDDYIDLFESLETVMSIIEGKEVDKQIRTETQIPDSKRPAFRRKTKRTKARKSAIEVNDQKNAVTSI